MTGIVKQCFGGGAFAHGRDYGAFDGNIANEASAFVDYFGVMDKCIGH